MKNWKKCILNFNITLKGAIKNLNKTGTQFIAVVDNKSSFFGTITDGDIRRYLIKSSNLNEKIKKIANTDPLVLDKSFTINEAKKIMKINQISHIPVVGKRKEIIKILSFEDTKLKNNFKNLFVIMAGGRGKRLLPLTKNIPKPMLQVVGQPILEKIILGSKKEGFYNFNLTVNYLANKIINYFGNGKKFGISINYTIEKKPLGTAGSLSKIKKHFDLPIILTNGDLLNEIKFSKILDYHNSNKADVTVATGIHQITNPYGVIQFKGINIQNIIEKPVNKSFINAGVYVINPELIKKIKYNSYLDMPNFITSLIKQNKKIIMYPLHESWIDIGTIDQLRKIKKKSVKN